MKKRGTSNKEEVEVLEDMYSVEKIIDKAFVNGKVYYRVKWLNFSHKECTWYCISSLKVLPGNLRVTLPVWKKTSWTSKAAFEASPRIVHG